LVVIGEQDSLVTAVDALPRNDVGLLLVTHDVVDGMGDRRCGAADDRVDAFLINPFQCLGDTDVGLVLIVGNDNLDRGSVDGAAEILDRHLDHQDLTGAAIVGIGAGLVGHHADADDIVRDVGTRRRCNKGRGQHQHAGKASGFPQCSHGFLPLNFCPDLPVRRLPAGYENA
jgi:hypothetical protein